MKDGVTAAWSVHQERSWVPQAAYHYIAHTEWGASIRGLARHAGCHASTISRQVRAFESRRDDPLVDEALRRLGTSLDPVPTADTALPEEISPIQKETDMTALRKTETCNTLSDVTDTRLKQDARRILRRLCETGAVLAVATDMDKAVVVRDTDAGSHRTAVVDRDVAEAMALKNWISCSQPGRISRYALTGAGRVALEQLLRDPETAPDSFAETEGAFLGDTSQDASSGQPRRKRYGLAESPLILLARRRNRDGTHFLSDTLVRAGERLREDFEMAQVSVAPLAGWDQVLAEAGDAADLAPCTRAARERVRDALQELGPGLGDVTLRCCCFLEGLETAEKRMGWSARSGKIVLRIA
ncbi:MAG: DUF6456 domain-containing protein, partial [Pseudomonadota bacterium]